MISFRSFDSSPLFGHRLPCKAVLRISAILLLFSFTLPQAGVAQRMTGAFIKFTNTFREWTIVTEDEDLRGELRLKWIHTNDWTAWDFTLGDTFATIEQKWTEDPNLWIIRCNGVTVNAKTAWSNEFLRWKLNDGKNQFNWESKYSNQRDEWELETRKEETFKIETYWEGNPTEWIIEDNLPDDVSMAMRIAMLFLTLHFSSPRT